MKAYSVARIADCLQAGISGSHKVKVPDYVHAISISPRSDIDRCIVALEEPALYTDPYGDAGTNDEVNLRRELIGANAWKLSVGSPLFLPEPFVKGQNIKVLAPYEENSRRGEVLTEPLALGIQLHGDMGGSGGALSVRGVLPDVPALELQLWHCMPTWFPTIRPPWEFLIASDDWANVGGAHPLKNTSSHLSAGYIDLPYFGRKRAEMVVHTEGGSGSITWSARVVRTIGVGGNGAVARESSFELGTDTQGADEVTDNVFVNRGPDWFRLVFTADSFTGALRVFLSFFDD